MYYIEGIHEKNIFPEQLPIRLERNIEDNFVYPLHWHSAIELLYVEKNDFDLFVNNTEYNIKESDVMVIAAGDTHEFKGSASGIRYFIQFDFSCFDFFTSNDIRGLLTDTLVFRKDNYIYEKLVIHIKEIITCFEQKAFGYDLFLYARIFDILCLLTQYLKHQDNIRTKSNRVSGLYKINEAFDYIHKNYAHDIHLDDISRIMGLSEYYFSRLFKQITEKNFYAYLNEYRIRQSEQLIRKTSMSITDIAYAVGFNSIVTFNRCFKTVKGCTPTVYKKIETGD